MLNPYMKAPHTDPARPISREALNAALLIDFDNVTMGMRSDLAKELKHLLESDIIKGKVTVQRAYADWRRYPQYIVPLSEASIDLIFAPAYGSSKKNATDIRMAIDGIELVFIRPEIGTFILLTGDSDFSSLVLKLKEYGKYVIGIGIQESSSDILVQNCDEYYSYTALTGLSKTSDDQAGSPDAWQCVEEAVQRMVSRGDVMRSDRLKQVIMEVSPGFNERDLGFKKFSKFLVEAANKGLLDIERADNGQYMVAPPGGKGRGRTETHRARAAAGNGDEQRRKGRRQPLPRRTRQGGAAKEVRASANRGQGAAGQSAGEAGPAAAPRDRAPALVLLRRALEEVGGRDDGKPRDSEVKRRMIAIDKGFSENALGFGKFSKFLQYAETEGVVSVERTRDGSYRVRLTEAPAAATAALADLDVKALGLPATAGSIKSYFANRYKGVGIKTAERLVGHFGPKVFQVLEREPERIRKVLTRSRADSVLTAWAEDYGRRKKALPKVAASSPAPSRRQDGRGDGPGRALKDRTAEVRTTRSPASGDTAGSTEPAGETGSAENRAGEPVPATAKRGRSGLFGFLRQGRRSR
ncbi:MAG: NYN domain-containing protein [Gemmatimonadota bacterium]|nr:NYN domain-containing protein [Gemmatimonadota bacterium]MDE2870900.1 NYN domain-containing protein [Gemmatimonadota bacterium]